MKDEKTYYRSEERKYITLIDELLRERGGVSHTEVLLEAYKRGEFPGEIRAELDNAPNDEERCGILKSYRKASGTPVANAYIALKKAKCGLSKLLKRHGLKFKEEKIGQTKRYQYPPNTPDDILHEYFMKTKGLSIPIGGDSYIAEDSTASGFLVLHDHDANTHQQILATPLPQKPQELQPFDGEKGIVRIPTGTDFQLLRWILSFGSHVTVVEPAAYREQVMEEIQYLNKLYTIAI